MTTQKSLTVATNVQKAVLEQVLIQEIISGFWKEARPADHGDAWKNTIIDVGGSYGAVGFEMPRNYNFVNPEFYKKAEEKLLEAAKTVEPEITAKQLKKQLIALNQILGGRLVEAGGEVTKLARGRKQAEPADEPQIKTTKSTTTRKAAAVFADPEASAEGTETMSENVVAEAQVEELEIA